MSKPIHRTKIQGQTIKDSNPRDTPKKVTTTLHNPSALECRQIDAAVRLLQPENACLTAIYYSQTCINQTSALKGYIRRYE